MASADSTASGHAGTSVAAVDLETLFAKRARYVAGIGLRLLGRDSEIDDLVQDVFLDALRGIHKLREPEAISAIAIVWFAQGGSQAKKAVLADNQIELQDGTRAIGLGTASTVKLVDQSEELVSFALESGKGWFEVTPSKTRRVEVQIKDVRVMVLGTAFVVEVKGEFVHVWVQRGKVQVVSSARARPGRDGGLALVEAGRFGSSSR